MNSDIRIAIGFFDHPKTIKLQRRCGLDGVISLLRLWEWAAQNRTTGELTGLDKEDIEIAAKWQGEEGVFFDAICELRFIDTDSGKMSLHDWAETNSWVASSEDRADKGRLNRMKSTNKDVYDILTSAGRTGISKEDYGLITSSKDKLRSAQALLKGCLSDTISPGPTPTPTPTPTPVPTPYSEGLSSAVASTTKEEIRFKPPSVQEVASYCQERGNGIDANVFIDSYEAKGWMIGKNKMKDWRAAVRTWEGRGHEAKPKGGSQYGTKPAGNSNEESPEYATFWK